MDEKQTVKALRKILADRYPKVVIHKELYKLSAFKAEIKNQLSFVPVLNEIDIMLVTEDGGLAAVEVKCFHVREQGGLTRPFYDGIGQALSLWRYGFDHVALWHIFSDEVDQIKLDKYGAGTWWFVRNQLVLPLDFTYFKFNNSSQSPVFTVMQYDGPNTAAELSIFDSKFPIKWRYRHPVADEPGARRMREILLSSIFNPNILG